MRYQLQTISLAFLILLTAVVGAFAVVWTRVETAQTAKENAQLEQAIARLQREEMHLSSVVANLERPESLKMILAELGSDFGPVSPDRQEILGSDSFAPDFQTVRVSSASATPTCQFSSSRPVRRPVFIRE